MNKTYIIKEEVYYKGDIEYTKNVYIKDGLKITIRANKPSEKALEDFANKILEISKGMDL